MNPTSIVLIGDGDRRQQIKRVLRPRRDLRVIGEIGEAQALPLVERLAADIVVLDCATLDINALIVLPWLKSLPIKSRVIALGANGTSTERRLLIELGAAAYATLEMPQTVIDVLPRDQAATTALGQFIFGTRQAS